jgi:hypothetical protein
MKDDTLTLRLSRELAQALSRWARDRGVPRSAVVREAVAGYVAARDAGPAPAPPLTAASLAARWPGLARLTPDEARMLERDLAALRRELPRARDSWES